MQCSLGTDVSLYPSVTVHQPCPLSPAHLWPSILAPRDLCETGTEEATAPAASNASTNTCEENMVTVCRVDLLLLLLLSLLGR